MKTLLIALGLTGLMISVLLIATASELVEDESPLGKSTDSDF